MDELAVQSFELVHCLSRTQIKTTAEARRTEANKMKTAKAVRSQRDKWQKNRGDKMKGKLSSVVQRIPCCAEGENLDNP